MRAASVIGGLRNQGGALKPDGAQAPFAGFLGWFKDNGCIETLGTGLQTPSRVEIF